MCANAIEGFLNAANRMMESDGVYWRTGRRPQTANPSSDDDDGGHDGDIQTEGNLQPDSEASLNGGIPVQVTRESGDLNAYQFGDAPQTFRTVLWSLDRDALGFNPVRGDVLRVGGETFKVVERDGVTWRRRFDGWGSRIMFYTEQQG